MGSGGGEDTSTATAAPVGLKKGPWTVAEDAILMEYVNKHGEGNWNAVQKNTGLSRCGKSCRLRWANHLRPNLKKGSFSPEEELLILHLHSQLGNKWARMAAQLPGRTDNEIKNYWNTRIKRRQRAGLPLYPAEMQRSPGTPPSLTLAPLGSVGAMPLLSQNLFQSSLPENSPRAKRFREDGGGGGGGFTFQVPIASPVSPVSPQPSSPLFNLGGCYGMGSMPAAGYQVKMELPSSQLYMDMGGGGGGGGTESSSGLLDALLQEAQAAGEVKVGRMMVAPPLPMVSREQELKWAIDGGDRKLGDSISICSTGISAKKEAGEEMNRVQDDISKLLDMIPAPAMAVPDWYNSDSGEVSNGGQSSVVTDDEIGLEMQQLASSLSIAPAEQDWNINACSWNNMPGIC